MGAEPDIEHLIKKSITKLLDYCQENNWTGFDPFDGLNSRIFSILPLFHNRIGRLIFIQAMKRSPLNLRHIFLVPKGENPKGLAVFCTALFILYDLRLIKNDDIVLRLLRRLIDLRSPNYSYDCWGYNFDWQSRSFFLPKYVPNIICTTFAGNALLDAYEKYGNTEYLEMAISSGHFLLKGLNITRNSDELCFSYTPLDNGQVHNASLLGAAFLSRLYSITDEETFVKSAAKAVRFSIRRQHEDGSWPYGEDKTQRWIDNFHTGYNLVAIKRFSEYTGNTEFTENIRKGFGFYKKNLFTEIGLPKYYDNQKYPIDIHSIAQSLITLAELKEFGDNPSDHQVRIFGWALKNMRHKEGWFFYQQRRYFKNKIPYMRWSQAWMLYGLAVLLKDISSLKDFDKNALTI